MGRRTELRVSKSQCSIFKEFYAAFLQGGVDKETRAWMAEHKEECNYCREWSRSFEENREDKVIVTKVQKDIFEGLKGAIKKRAKIFSGSHS